MVPRAPLQGWDVPTLACGLPITHPPPPHTHPRVPGETIPGSGTWVGSSVLPFMEVSQVPLLPGHPYLFLGAREPGWSFPGTAGGKQCFLGCVWARLGGGQPRALVLPGFPMKRGNMGAKGWFIQLWMPRSVGLMVSFELVWTQQGAPFQASATSAFSGVSLREWKPVVLKCCALHQPGGQSVWRLVALRPTRRGWPWPSCFSEGRVFRRGEWASIGTCVVT